MFEEVVIPGPCINFKIAVLARFMDERYRRAYEGLGLTTEQVRMLLNLKRAGNALQKHLADRLELEKSSFSRTLKSMTDKGFIKRKANPADKRAVLLALTEKGEKKVEKIFPAWKKMHEETHRLFGEAAVSEIDRMLRILKTQKQL